MSIELFRIEVPEAGLTDLKSRLAATRWPDQLPSEPWAHGVPVGYLKELATYWSTGSTGELGKVRARERRRRHDFCVKTAHQLVHDNALVVLEKLPVWNMTRRAKPVADPAKPGQYVPNGRSAKSGLNRAILSKGWFRFELALKSASRYGGTQVVKVPGAFTSQRCLGVWACGPEIP